MTLTIDDYAADFSEDPGFLDFGAIGPLGRAVVEEEDALQHVLEHARPGSLPVLFAQQERLREAAARMLGRRPDQIAVQPNTSTALMHVAFGLTGGVALSPAEFPSLTFAVQRAADALGVLRPHWLELDGGAVTPGELRDRLDPSVGAVMVSLVDFRTGHLADLDGIRQVIGDRLLVVDATQGMGVVDAPFEVADVVAAGGQKWPRAGWGTGILALSDRATERLTPVWSGFPGTDADGLPLDEVPPPTRGAGAFAVSNPDQLACARYAVALERITEVGLGVVADRVVDRAEALTAELDRVALPVVSPRERSQRAGLVVTRPEPEALTALVAALHNAGVTATVRAGTVRFGVHVSSGDEGLAQLRSALVEFRTARTV